MGPIPSNAGSRITYPEFDELMHLYHRNVFEYNRTTQNILNEISSNQSRSAREIREISNISHAFNQNMQEYHNITDNCLDLLRDMYFSQNSHNRYTNVNVDTVNNRANVTNRTNVNNPNSNFIPQTNTTTTISPPRTLFSYTLFPYVGTGTDGQRMGQRVVSETPSLLTQQQIHDSTEEYTYSSDPIQTIVPVCPISLEDFQEGDSITRIRECLHEFKTPHLSRWFLRSSRCPVCRWNLLSPPTVRSNRSRSNSQLMVPPDDLRPDFVRSPPSSSQPTGLRPSGWESNTTAIVQGGTTDTSYSTTTVTTLPSRLQDILADPSLNQLSQQLFSNIFQNMLMNTTDAPPNIVNGSADASFNIQSLFGSGSESFINSIDITYTIDYDGSSNATIE
jgi:conjugal transfer/entry exclusion protein